MCHADLQIRQTNRKLGNDGAGGGGEWVSGEISMTSPSLASTSSSRISPSSTGCGADVAIMWVVLCVKARAC